MMFTVGSGSLFIPSTMVSLAQQDGLLSVVISMIYSVFAAYLFSQLTVIYPGMSIMEMLDAAFGKWLGKLFQIVLLIILFFGGPAPLFYDVSSFTSLYILPTTPDTAISLVFGIIVIAALRSGLRTIAISAELLYPIYLGIIIFMMITLTKEFDITNLHPLFDSHPYKVSQGVLVYSAFSVFPLISFLMIYPNMVEKPERAFYCFCRGMLLGSLILFALTLACILVLDIHLTSLLQAPSYMLGKEISVFHTLSRIEVVTALFWYISLFYKLLIYYYAVLAGLKYMFRLTQYKVLILPMTMILCLLAGYFFHNPIQQSDWSKRVFTVMMLIAGFVIPMLLLIVGSMSRRSKTDQAVDKPT